MQRTITLLAIAGLIVMLALTVGSSCKPADVVRPEEILSMRLVCFDQATYAELATLWDKYLKVYPSEYAYGQ